MADAAGSGKGYGTPRNGSTVQGAWQTGGRSYSKARLIAPKPIQPNNSNKFSIRGVVAQNSPMGKTFSRA
jgi:hypothetical protein